jgi:hypothetical protein
LKKIRIANRKGPPKSLRVAQVGGDDEEFTTGYSSDDDEIRSSEYLSFSEKKDKYANHLINYQLEPDQALEIHEHIEVEIEPFTPEVPFYD